MQIDICIVMGCCRTNLISTSWPSLLCYCCAAHFYGITWLISHLYWPNYRHHRQVWTLTLGRVIPHLVLMVRLDTKFICFISNLYSPIRYNCWVKGNYSREQFQCDSSRENNCGPAKMVSYQQIYSDISQLSPGLQGKKVKAKIGTLIVLLQGWVLIILRKMAFMEAHCSKQSHVPL